MSGALMCLSLVFSSCGNVDNPLEEIGNSNPVVAQLKDALVDGAVITITFNLNGEQTITFKKGEDGNYRRDDGNTSQWYHLEYNEETGLLELWIRDEDDNNAAEIFFNPKDNSFYIVNNVGYNTTSNGKFSVNGVEGTLTDVCPDKATIKLWYREYEGAGCRAGTRSLGPVPGVFAPDGFINADRSLIVRYKMGETWQNVYDRYAISNFSDVLQTGNDGQPKIFVYDGKFDESHEGMDSYEGDSDGDFTLCYDNTNRVKLSQKVGVKDDEIFGDAYGDTFENEYYYPAIGNVVYGDE